jgi:hypothetical protein
METSMAVSGRRFSERSQVKGNMTDIAIMPVDIMTSEQTTQHIIQTQHSSRSPTPLVDERTSISRKTSRRGRGIKENPD